MSPTNFENSIKEKLEERRISPSNESWKTLSNQLDKNKNYSFKTFLIAASLIGIIFTVLLNFNNQKQPISKTIETVKDSVLTGNDFITSTEKKVDSVIENHIEKKDFIPQLVQNDIQLKNKEIEPKINKVLNTTTPQFQKNNSSSEGFLATSFIKKDSNLVPLENEIELLLAQAKSNINIESNIDTSIIVDYKSLLEDAEIELEIDNSLKNKIFKAVVTNYNSLSNNNKKEQ